MAQLLIVTNSALNRIKPGWAGTIEVENVETAEAWTE